VAETELTEDAVSHDARHVAFADLAGVQDDNVVTGQRAELRDPSVQALSFVGADQLDAIDSGGVLHTISGSGARDARQLPLQDGSVRTAGFSPDGRTGVIVTSTGRVLVIELTDGGLLGEVPVDSSLVGVLGVNFSSDGRLAVIVANSGVWIIDVHRLRVIWSIEGYTNFLEGSEPRDAVISRDDDEVYVVFADEGIAAYPLPTWLGLDGTALLRATASAVPRPFSDAELRDVPPIPLVGSP
jgi:WD40 repeat protein